MRRSAGQGVGRNASVGQTADAAVRRPGRARAGLSFDRGFVVSVYATAFFLLSSVYVSDCGRAVSASERGRAVGCLAARSETIRGRDSSSGGSGSAGRWA